MEQLDLTFVDEVVGKVGTGKEKVLEILQAIQGRYGYLPREALHRVCELTEISPAAIAGVSTFYDQFRHRPAGRHIIHVCVGTACHVRGATRILDTLKDLTGIQPGETDLDLKFSLETVNCLGCCALGPVMVVDGKTHGKLSPSDASDVMKRYE